MAVGIHIIADLYGIDSETISEASRLYPIIEGAVKFGGLTKISSNYYQFQPKGASGIVLLAESHLSFHTWPEHGLVTLDIFTCGNPNTADSALQYIVDILKPTNVECKRIQRGDKISSEDSIPNPAELVTQ